MILHMLGCTLVVSLAAAFAFAPAAQANTSPLEQLALRQHHGDWVKLRNTRINKQRRDQQYKEVGKPGPDSIIFRIAPYDIDLA